MRIVISHPTGNQFSKAAVKGFEEAGILQSYYTALASFPDSFSYKLSSVKWLSDIQRRSIDINLKPYVHMHPWKEAGRLMFIKMGAKKLTEHERGMFSVDKIYADLDNYVAKKLESEKKRGATALYAYEDGAVCSFANAKKMQLKTIYDLPIGYWRAMHCIFKREQEINLPWAETLDGLKDSAMKLDKKDREIGLSDAIIVASSFTSSTLSSYPEALPPVYVVPYGFPPVNTPKQNRKYRGEPLKLLFVGGLSQRKGLSYLFKAIEGLEKYITLTIVGRLPQTTCEPLSHELKKHKYISTLPHGKVLELMRQHDMLVLPSLFEGFGQVITEAMAQGTPVITTERTAGPDIISHGENGWLVNAGSAEAIKNILEYIISGPQIIAEVGEQALETAKQRPWSVYGEELVKAVLTES